MAAGGAARTQSIDPCASACAATAVAVGTGRERLLEMVSSTG